MKRKNTKYMNVRNAEKRYVKRKWNLNVPTAISSTRERDSTHAKSAERFSPWKRNCGYANTATTERTIFALEDADAPSAERCLTLRASASPADGRQTRDGLEKTTDNFIFTKKYNNQQENMELDLWQLN